jgi:hypothetical protein
MAIKITPEEYARFQEHYAWQLLKSPDYRLGQAFLNYFPEISHAMLANEDGNLEEYRFYNETDPDKAQDLIARWLDQ